MAGVRAGVIPTMCHLCPSNKKVREHQGCDKKARNSLFIYEVMGVEKEFFRCPTKYVPNNLYEFFSIYDYSKEFNNSMGYDGASNKFIEANGVYARKINQINRERAK